MFKFYFSLPSKATSAESDEHLSITGGEIYIETEDGYFPGLGWDDRLLSVISHWISNMLVLLDPKYGEQTATNYFMDGPYFFNLQKREKDRITIQFIKRVDESETTEVIPSVTITLAEYGDALLSLSEGIIKDPNFRWLEKEQTRINFERSVARLRVML